MELMLRPVAPRTSVGGQAGSARAADLTVLCPSGHPAGAGLTLESASGFLMDTRGDVLRIFDRWPQTSAPSRRGERGSQWHSKLIATSLLVVEREALRPTESTDLQAAGCIDAPTEYGDRSVMIG